MSLNDTRKKKRFRHQISSILNSEINKIWKLHFIKWQIFNVCFVCFCSRLLCINNTRLDIHNVPLLHFVCYFIFFRMYMQIMLKWDRSDRLTLNFLSLFNTHRLTSINYIWKIYFYNWLVKCLFFAKKKEEWNQFKKKN